MAFSGFYREHHAAVRRYAARRIGSEAADEVTAETFTVAWRRWPQARRGGLPWLYRTASFQVQTLRRGTRRRHGLREHLASVVASQPVDPGDVVPDRVAVAAALLAVSDTDRELLVLSAWEDLGPAELAVVLGCSRAAAAVRLHRARRRLRVHLTQYAPDVPADGLVPGLNRSLP